MTPNNPKKKSTQAASDHECEISKSESKFEWSVNAFCYMKDSPDKPCQEYIPIPWHGDNLKMTETNIRSGIPVDANLAVHYIKNFFDYYTLLIQNPPPINFLEAGDLQNVKNNFDLLYDHHEKYRKLHQSIFDLTYGMTLDKDLLLKIISQPLCEGVRFYLCARIAEEDNQVHLSLVTVGVDKKGCDLHYDLKDTLTENELTPGVNAITTQSLTGEYATPPPPYNTGILKQEDMSDYKKRFVLLNLAKQQQLDIKAAKKQKAA